MLIPMKFLAFVLNGVPNLFNWMKKKGRIHEINRIEKDARTANDASDNKRLSDAFKKYDNDVKASG